MKVAIVGSREGFGYLDIAKYVKTLPPGTVIVSGGARGVDSFARQAATFFNLFYIEYPADWDAFGRMAGFLRNEEIVKYADKVVAFWDGSSKGTKHSIDLALKHRKSLEVIFP